MEFLALMVTLVVFTSVSSGSIRGLLLFMAGVAISFCTFYMLWRP
jgi:hypothetical protein